MRSSIIFIAILAFIVVGAGGYTIVWFTQAAHIKSGLERAIAKANEKEKHITYNAIETSGFPSSLNVTIVQPHFTGHMDELLKAMKPVQPLPGTATLPANTQWSEDILLNGNITFSINALSDHYGVAMNGTWMQNSVVQGQRISMTTQSPGVFSCTLQMAHGSLLSGALFSYHRLSEQAKEFAKNFRQFDCINPGYTTTDATTHEKLISAGGGRIYIVNTPKGTMQQARLYLKSIDAEITPKGDAVVGAYVHMLAPEYPYSPHLSLYGKQNLELDLTYDGPADWKDGNVKNLPLDIHLAKFDLSNQAYTTDAAFHLSNAVAGESRNSALELKAVTNFGKSYDALMQDSVHNFIQQLYARKPIQPAMSAFLEKYTPDQMYSIIYPALPDFVSLGRVTEALDVSFQGSSDLKMGNVTLKDLELSATPYGITGSGTAQLTRGRPIPAANVTLTCDNCMRMIDDIVSYAGRIQKTMQYFDPAKAATMVIDPQLIGGIKQFLAALAVPNKDPKSTNLTYTFVSDGGTDLLISGQRLDAVMGLYKEYIVPVMPKPQAAAQ